MVPWAHLECTPGGTGNWEVLGYPNAINQRFSKGALPEGGQSQGIRVCQKDSFMEGMGTTESREVGLLDIAIHISHEDDGVSCGLPRGKGGREVPEEGNTGTGEVTSRFQMAVLLGVNSLEAGFLGFIGVVATDEMDTAASAALQAKPGPAA